VAAVRLTRVRSAKLTRVRSTVEKQTTPVARSSTSIRDLGCAATLAHLAYKADLAAQHRDLIRHNKRPYSAQYTAVDGRLFILPPLVTQRGLVFGKTNPTYEREFLRRRLGTRHRAPANDLLPKIRSQRGRADARAITITTF
jgi:hypothetical protein